MRELYWILVEADGPNESEDEAGDIESAIGDALGRRLEKITIAGSNEELLAHLAVLPVTDTHCVHLVTTVRTDGTEYCVDCDAELGRANG